MSTPAERVIGAFGRMSELARALGHTNVTTVQGWKERGVIPTRHLPAILDAARARGIELTAEDCILPAPRPTPDLQAAS